MRIVILNLALFFVSVSFLNAQDCVTFIPDEQGTILQHTHYDKKGKVTGISELKVDNIETVDSATIFFIKQKHTDPKGKDPVVSELEFKCVEERFYMDMTTYIDQETIKAYEDMEMTITSNDMNFPKDMIAGQRLSDGSVKLEIKAGTIPMTFTVDIKNRLVEDIDSMSTPAGIFPCIRISEDVLSNFGFMKFSYHMVSWYSEKIGVLRSETYKGDKLKSRTELTAIKKE